MKARSSSSAATKRSSTRRKSRTRNPLLEQGRFIGRERELNALGVLYTSNVRLVTLCGPAGVGKTRLAVQFSQSVRERYAGRVWICDVAHSRTMGSLIGAIAGVLPHHGATQRLDGVDELAAMMELERPALLVIDNAEVAVAPLVELLRALRVGICELRVLVTSRQPLGTVGEARYEVSPLEPDLALALFESRVIELSGRDRLTEKERAIAVTIVAELERIPLAIELAAAHAALLPAEEVLALLRDRVGTLQSRRRDITFRHMSLENAIAWSWQLLSKIERAVLTQSSVFAGGFSMASVRGVVELPAGSDLTSVILSLREKCLIRTDPDGENARLGLYESVRHYASRELAKTPQREREVRARYVQYITQWGESMVSGLRGADGASVRQLLASETDNLLSAFEHSRSDTTTMRLSLVLGSLHATVGLFDRQKEFFDTALRVESDDRVLRARVLLARARVFCEKAELEPAERDLHEALGLLPAEKLVLRAQGLCLLSRCARWKARAGEAEQWLREAFEIARRLKDERLEADVLSEMAAVANHSNDPARSHSVTVEALAAYQSQGDAANIAISIAMLGLADLDTGSLDSAEAHFRRSLELQRSAGNRPWEGILLGRLASVLHERQQFEDALSLYDQSLGLSRDTQRVRMEVIDQTLKALMLLEMDDSARARACIERAVQLSRGVDVSGADSAVWAMLAAVEARDGNNIAAQQALAHAFARLKEFADARLHAIHLVVTEWLAVFALDGVSDARRHGVLLHAEKVLRQVSELGAGQVGRLVSRMLQRVLDAMRGVVPRSTSESNTDAGAVAHIAHDASWFQAPNRERAPLARREVLRRVLHALVQQRLDHVVVPLTVGDIVKRAWPGEKILPRAAADRVYAAMKELRADGLEGWILRSQGGYILHSSVHIEHPAD